jgi:hypothetical protein
MMHWIDPDCLPETMGTPHGTVVARGIGTPNERSSPIAGKPQKPKGHAPPKKPHHAH